MTKEQFIKRLKSFAWRAGGAAFVAGATYVLNIGNIQSVNPTMLLNLTVMAVISLALGEVTKQVNNPSED